MTFKNLFLSASIVMLTTACGSTYTPVNNVVSPTIMPNIGAISKINMGEQLFVEGTGFMSNCIVPNFAHTETFGLGTRVVSVKPFENLCETHYQGKYRPQYDNVVAMTGGYKADSFKWDVEVKDNPNSVTYCIFDGCFDKPLGSYQKKRAFVFNESSLKQVIEYMGKSGSILEFTYSEYMNNIARDAFTRTFKVDLNDTNFLSFKGAKVEILDASSSEITYKVLQGFK